MELILKNLPFLCGLVFTVGIWWQTTKTLTKAVENQTTALHDIEITIARMDERLKTVEDSNDKTNKCFSTRGCSD